MSIWRVLIAAMVLVAAPAQPDPKYFRYTADVTVSETAQSYVSIPPEVWTNATSDLRDLRLYNGTTQVPYLLTPGSSEEVRGRQSDATILNLGRVNGSTQFIVDTHQGDARAAYESVQLTVRDDTPDFVTTARVEGFNRFEDAPVDLGKSTLFKLEGEKLGANLSVRFKPVIFRYLRITMPKPEPRAITSAHVFSPGTTYSWTNVPLRTTMSNAGHDSVYEWDAIDTVPVGRITFATDETKDFWRRVELQGEHASVIVDGAIWSIQRRGNTDRSTNLELLVPGEARSKYFKLIVHNGDDQPLKLTIAASYRERRLYFTPSHAGTFRLYFADAELERPAYDYARTNSPSNDAKVVQLTGVKTNPDYAPRPDKRPWTEQHPAVLWIALGLAVVGLGAVALRSLKGEPATREPGTGNRET